MRRGREGVRDRWGREGGLVNATSNKGENIKNPIIFICHVDSLHCPRQQRDFFLEKKSLDSYLDT